MKKIKIGILGSTGSIGTQTLEVADNLENIEVVTLSANSNVQLLENQIRKYKPKVACIADEAKYSDLKARVSDTDTRIVSGKEGMVEVSVHNGIETLVTSVVGIAGLVPTVEAIKAKKNIALANKETLVVAGEIVTKLAKDNQVKILPVDSEHGAIFQCLQGCGDKKEIRKIILTASGGPFFGKTKDSLANVTVKETLNHPNWSMGKKITVDSATLMNKGFEVMEARWLFDMDIDDIEVVVHRESIIHSMVEYTDNSVIALLSYPDMKLPIQYALTYPKRHPMPKNPLDFNTLTNLSFYKPDIKTFECLKLAEQAAKAGGTMPAVLNGANEICVDLFLRGKIGFLDIADIIKKCMNGYNIIKNPTLKDVMEADFYARNTVITLL